MSAPQIQINLPNPFLPHSATQSVPVSKSERVDSSQYITSNSVSVTQLGSTLIVNLDELEVQTILVPPAKRIINYVSTSRGAKPGVDDYLVVDVYNVGQSDVTFVTAAPSSGSKVVAAGKHDSLVVRYTDVSVSDAAYVIV